MAIFRLTVLTLLFASVAVCGSTSVAARGLLQTASPPPPGACGDVLSGFLYAHQAYFFTYDSLTTKYNTTVDVCLGLCNNNASCIGFTMDLLTNQCRIKANLKATGPFYSATVDSYVRCTAIAPPPPPHPPPSPPAPPAPPKPPSPPRPPSPPPSPPSPPSPPAPPAQSCGEVIPGYLLVYGNFYFTFDNLLVVYNSSPENCSALCNNNSTCIGFTMNVATSQCRTKKALRLGGPFKDANTNSYVRCDLVSPPPPPSPPPNPPPQPPHPRPPPSPPSPPSPPAPPSPPPVKCGDIFAGYVVGHDLNYFYGNTLSETYGGTADECRSLCDTLGTTSCVGFRYRPSTAALPTSICQTQAKLLISTPLPYIGWDSYFHCGLLSPPPSPPPPATCGSDIVDFNKFPLLNYFSQPSSLGFIAKSKCASLCQANTACYGFLYSLFGACALGTGLATTPKVSTATTYLLCGAHVQAASPPPSSPPPPALSPPPFSPPPPSPPPAAQCGAIFAGYTFHNNTNYKGYELSRAVATAASCSQLCQANVKCVGFTYKKGVCYMKQDLAAANKDKSVVAYILCPPDKLPGYVATETCGSTVKGYLKRSGYDANPHKSASFKVAAPKTCGVLCKKSKKCTGFVTFNSTCFFKTTTVKLTYNINAAWFGKC
eukprot:TRINITY_DN3889_c0_g1_i1.p1 TRINITY_DN3889_c0_g1~~TRINITY_DN3889_c0_g1_i1.p1  ORF type:complete len:657 (+),score=76.50 TRINITY_DN3889_c0_g1_i1:574-2544(+)